MLNHNLDISNLYTQEFKGGTMKFWNALAILGISLLFCTYGLSILRRKNWDLLKVKESHDDLFLEYQVPPLAETVDFNRDIIRWAGKMYYRHPEERKNKHYIYGDVTNFMRTNEPFPAKFQNVQVQDLTKFVTEYVTGYARLGGIAEGVYPIALEDNPTHIISLTQQERFDRSGKSEGVYGGSKLNFLTNMFVLLQGGTSENIRKRLQDAVFDLAAKNITNLKSDQKKEDERLKNLGF